MSGPAWRAPGRQERVEDEFGVLMEVECRVLRDFEAIIQNGSIILSALAKLVFRRKLLALLA